MIRRTISAATTRPTTVRATSTARVCFTTALSEKKTAPASERMRRRWNVCQPVVSGSPRAATRSMWYQVTNSATASRTAPVALRMRPVLGLSKGGAPPCEVVCGRGFSLRPTPMRLRATSIARVMRPLVDPEFWRGRVVLVTGHTGFKGAWLALWLQPLGARVSGLSDCVPTDPSLFELARVGDAMSDVRGDVRDYPAVLATLAAAEPEIVVHMAAQPFVRRSFLDPRTTYETNVMGTVNVLEAGRATPSARGAIRATTH